MFRSLYWLIFLLVSSCASLEEVVSEKLRIGMTKTQFCSAVFSTFVTSDPCYSYSNSYYLYSPLIRTELIGVNNTYFVFKDVQYKALGEPLQNGGTLVVITKEIELARETARTGINPNNTSGYCKFPKTTIWNNCYGEYYWDNGDSYKGEWKNNKRHGTGTYVYKSGTKFSGEWKDGYKDGQGTSVFASGGKFIGLHKKGFRIEGKTFYEDGSIYEGEYEETESTIFKQGKGKLTWKSGDMFVGTFYQDKKLEGILFWEDGRIYNGDWKDNNYHGQGTYTDKDGIYTGEFKEGNFHGFGVIKKEDGTLVYSGNWIEGQREGETEIDKEQRLKRQELNKIETQKQEKIERERRDEEASERRRKIDKLYKGSNYELAVAVQELLVDIGYKLKVDGKPGINTITAIKAFQQEVKARRIDGKISEKLLIQLQRYVSNKPAVKQLDLNLYNRKSTGSGVLINNDGFILTNQHVVDGCSLLTSGNDKLAILVKADSINDIAIIRTSDTENLTSLRFSDSDAELGEKIFVAGYPLNQYLENLNFTSGSVSSEAGFLQNISEFQFSAPIQSGNSGGPILNEYGGIVGIAVSSLSNKKFEEFTDSLVQNINYGIKKSSLESLLKLSDVEFDKGNPNYFRASDKQVAQIAKSGTVLIKCWVKKE
jgi:hypothetical protein